MPFYGREAELNAIALEADKVKRTGTASLVVLTGRRHVGKTTLVLKACENTQAPYLYCLVRRWYTEKELAASCLKQIAQVFGLEFLPNLNRSHRLPDAAQ